MRRCSLVVVIALLCGACGRVVAEAPPAHPSARSMFDPARHMRVSEVHRGMTGYGLSVFQGTTIEKFDVEVIDVLKNFNPKGDVVLIRCRGANLEHTGAIAGMSGSPVYLHDEQGNARMIGAFAYGWPLMKDPVGGVQPIEYMLELPVTTPATQPAPVQTSWRLSDSIALPGMEQVPSRYPTAGWGNLSPNPLLGGAEMGHAQLRPLATPLMTAGLPPGVIKDFSPLFSAYGLVPLQSGGGSAPPGAPADDPMLEPGSVLVVPLLTGDVDFSAVGTCTEVIEDQVFGFGHGFNNEGSVSLPMGSGRINAVIANLVTSFKLGQPARTLGTLSADQLVGVAGKIGDAPQTVPIELRVIYTDGTFDQTYHFQSAVHPQFTPLLSGAAIASALTGRRELPQYHTLDYELMVEFANGRSIQMKNELVNSGAGMLFFEVGASMLAAADNPFERVMASKVSGTVHVTPEAREATILYVNIPRLKFRPGQRVKAYVAYRPFRAAEAILPIEFDLPAELPEGQYQLKVSDWQQYLQDEQLATPFRFVAENIDGVFAVLQDVAKVKHNALYVRLLRQPDGIAIGRTAMPHLPSSRREVLMGSGRSNTTPFVSSTVKTIPTDRVMSGSAEFMLTIDKDAKVEVGGAKPPPAPSPDAAEPVQPKQSPSPGAPGEGRGEGSS